MVRTVILDVVDMLYFCVRDGNSGLIDWSNGAIFGGFREVAQVFRGRDRAGHLRSDNDSVRTGGRGGARASRRERKRAQNRH